MKRLRWQILVVTVTLVVVAVLLLSQQPVLSPTSSQPTSGGIYSEALIGSLGRLNPLLDWNNPPDRDVDRLVFSGLIKFDARGLPQPDLAESWGATPDGTVYNFTLRSSVVWQDGSPVTSDDVIFTIGLIKSSSFFPQDIKDLWNQITVTRLDDENIKFTLPEPFAPFLDYLTFGVLPKHLLASTPANLLASANFNINPVGSGPYKFDHFVVENGHVAGMVLTLSDNYYGQKPYIQQVVFRYYPDSKSAYDAFKQGDVLGVSQLTSDILPDALNDPNLLVYTSSLPQMSIVMLNLNNNEVAFLQNANVRQALMLGLNRDYMISSLLKGEGIIADSPILPGSWAHYDGIQRIGYDPDAAVALLKQEGYVIPASGGNRPLEERPSPEHDPGVSPGCLACPDRQADPAGLGADRCSGQYPGHALRSTDLQCACPAHVSSRAGGSLTWRARPILTRTRFGTRRRRPAVRTIRSGITRRPANILNRPAPKPTSRCDARLYRNFQVVFAKELPSLPLYYPVYNYGVSAQVHGVQLALPMYDTSDRLAFIADWYLVTRRTIEGTPLPATP